MKRVLRIYPGFIVAFLLSLLVVGPLAGGHIETLMGREGINQFLRMLLLRGPQLQGAFAGLPGPQLNSSLWTIAYEFRCYLLTMAFGALGIVRNRKAYLAVTLLLLGLLAVVPGFSVDIPVPLLALTGTVQDDVRLFAIFCCGGLFYLFHDEIRYRLRWALLALLGMCIAMFSRRFAEHGVAILGGYALFWFIFHARANLLSRLDNRFDLSYGVYLYAWPIENLILLHFRNISPWVLFGYSTVLATVLGAASWIMVERPFLRMKGRVS